MSTKFEIKTLTYPLNIEKTINWDNNDKFPHNLTIPKQMFLLDIALALSSFAMMYITGKKYII